MTKDYFAHSAKAIMYDCWFSRPGQAAYPAKDCRKRIRSKPLSLLSGLFHACGLSSFIEPIYIETPFPVVNSTGNPFLIKPRSRVNKTAMSNRCFGTIPLILSLYFHDII